jgi:hypothetical protein
MKILNWKLTRMKPGDMVAAVAKPVARAIDAATSVLPAGARTDLQHCEGCARRQEQLNRLVK